MSNVRDVKKLPSPQEIVRAFPLSAQAQARTEQDRAEVRAILAGQDERLLVVVGPCSAWPSPAVLEYARRLLAVEAEVRGELKLVLRTYIQKPRTTRGWTGPVNQPDPFATPDIEAGVLACRRLMVEVLELGLPIADEAVFTHNAEGFVELLSWVAIGARSTEDQEHRIWASAVDAPVGMKNPTSGSIAIGVNGVLAAQHPHTAVFNGHQVETAGNPFAHLVLRGGASGPNFRLHDLYRACKHMAGKGIHNPAVLIDASHDNSLVDGAKDPRAQIDVVRDVLANLRVHRDLQGIVKGFLVESFLKTGCQKLEQVTPESVDRDGLSITDPCLGWDETHALLRDMASRFAEMRSARSA